MNENGAVVDVLYPLLSDDDISSWERKGNGVMEFSGMHGIANVILIDGKAHRIKEDENSPKARWFAISVL